MFMSLLAMSVLDYISQTNVIIGLSLVVIGIVVAMLAMRIARVVRRTNEVSANDSIVLAMRIIGFIFILAGCIISIIQF